MDREIVLLQQQMKDAFEGEPWFGRSTKAILSEINESLAFEKPQGQHSILELLWHMINWKEFALSRLHKTSTHPMKYFEENDWRNLDHNDKTLWKKGLEKFSALHHGLVVAVGALTDEILSQKVEEREYDFRNLLYGIIEHDIYHLGQIAYVKKLLQK